ncbi:hypothetical protein BJ138DRAFT_1165184, partial [Hygrophoropsis aurantiaca]
MVAFALKTAFVLFTFFAAVANSSDNSDDDLFDGCDERQLNLKHGSMLQLFGGNGCITETPYDHQIITVVVDDSCVCRPVIYGDEIHSLGEKIASLVFDPGMQTPEAVFTLFQGEDCFGSGSGPFTGPFTAINFPLGDDKVKFAQICSSTAVKERELEAHKAHIREEKAAEAAADNKKHGSGWHTFKNDAKAAKHGIEKLAAGAKVTKTEVEKGLGAVGIGAAGVGVLEAVGVVAVL